MILPFGIITRPSLVALNYLKYLGLENHEPPTPTELIIEDLKKRKVRVVYFDPRSTSQEFKDVLPYDEFILSIDGREERVMGINAARPPNRQRFSLFHGTGHILMPWHRKYDYSVMNLLTTRPIELEAHEFAATLNMPPKSFKQDIDISPISFDTIHHLSDKYHASLESTLIRYVSLSDKPCASAILRKTSIRGTHIENSQIDFFNTMINTEYRVLDTEATDYCLRIRYSKNSQIFPHFIRRGTRILKKDNPLFRALDSGKRCEGEIPGEIIGFPLKTRLIVDCQPLNLLHNPGEIAAFITPINISSFYIYQFPDSLDAIQQPALI